MDAWEFSIFSLFMHLKKMATMKGFFKGLSQRQPTLFGEAPYLHLECKLSETDPSHSLFRSINLASLY